MSIRPTADRVRESLFNMLTSRFAGLFLDCRVLDLFAGTGALGLEALSRGASACVFVEESAEGRELIRFNIETLSLQGCTTILRRDASALGDAGTIKPFGLLFADPPYGKGLGQRALASALKGGWLEPGAVCVVEESASAGCVTADSFELLDERRYGDTAIRIFHCN